MNFELISTSDNSSSNILIPLSQDDSLLEKLNEISIQYQITEGLLQKNFKAESKEVHWYYANNQRIHLLGLGKNPQSSDYILCFRSFFHQNKNKLTTRISIDFRNQPIQFIENAINGTLLAKYDIQLYKTDKKTEENFFFTTPNIQILIAENNFEIANQLIQKAEVIAQTQMEMMDLVNAPANKKNPKTLVDWAVQSGNKYQYTVEILDQKALIEKGLYALLSVSQGSVHPPYLIVMEYKPAEDLPKIGLVGKGVTFDTGGTSLKQSANMHYMKSDMGGAAAVLGMIQVAAQLKLPIHLIGVVPTTENFIDSQSTKPGDVIDSYLGKTIEVIDTDAEGRLILADGLAYLNRNFKPEVLIDLATLTGSCVATLGYVAAGLFTNNDELANQLMKSGEKSGEKIWRLPLWDDYKGDISSDVADVRNYSGKPIAGAISAAKFLEVFTENHPAFAHLDIAGVAFGDAEFATSKIATGYGLRLLLDYIENLINSK